MTSARQAVRAASSVREEPSNINKKTYFESGPGLFSCCLLLGLAQGCGDTPPTCGGTKTPCAVAGEAVDGGPGEAAGGAHSLAAAGGAAPASAGGAAGAEGDAGEAAGGTAAGAGGEAQVADGAAPAADGGAAPDLDGAAPVADGALPKPDGPTPEAGPATDPRCTQGFLDCNLDARDGCETDPRSDVLNCGVCQRTCSGTNATRTACVEGTCKPRCAAGFGSCSAPPAAGTDEGCETDLRRPESCGACSRDCLGGACGAGGVCEPYVVAQTGDFARYPVADDEAVYWVEGGVVPRDDGTLEGSIERAPREGGRAARLRTGVFSNVATDGESLYGALLDARTGDAAMQSRFDVIGMDRRNGVTTAWLHGGSIYSAPGVTAHTPTTVTVGRTNVAWYDFADETLQLSPKVPPLGTQPSPRAVAHAAPLTLALHLDDNQAFLGTVSGIFRSSLGGDAVEPFARGADTYFAADATHVYYGSPKGIVRQPKSGGEEQVLVPFDAEAGPFFVAVGPRAAYFAHADGIFSVPRSGGRATHLVTAPEYEGFLHHAHGVLYWMDRGETARRRVLRAVVP